MVAKKRSSRRDDIVPSFAPEHGVPEVDGTGVPERKGKTKRRKEKTPESADERKAEKKPKKTPDSASKPTKVLMTPKDKMTKDQTPKGKTPVDKTPKDKTPQVKTPQVKTPKDPSPTTDADPAAERRDSAPCEPCESCGVPCARLPCENPHMDTGVLCGSVICEACDEEGGGHCSECRRARCGGCFGVRSFDAGCFAASCPFCFLPWFVDEVDHIATSCDLHVA